MKIAVEGDDALCPTDRAVVLLDMSEAADLYKDLHKIFGGKQDVVVKAPLAPFPKIDVPPLRQEPVPGTERQKTIRDYIREMEESKKKLPYKPFEDYKWVPDPFGPGLPSPSFNPMCWTHPNMTGAVTPDLSKTFTGKGR